MARVFTSSGEIIEWPYLSRDRPVVVDAAKLKACLAPTALERAKAAAALTPREIRRLFDRPKRWETLARTWRRIARWKLESAAAKLNEREIKHCAQGGTRKAFLARLVRSEVGQHIRPRWNKGLPRVDAARGTRDVEMPDLGLSDTENPKKDP